MRAWVCISVLIVTIAVVLCATLLSSPLRHTASSPSQALESSPLYRTGAVDDEGGLNPIQRARTLHPVPVSSSSGSSRRIVAATKASSANNSSGGDHDRRPSLALVRMMSTKDIDQLFKSFEFWDKLNLGICEDFDADIILSFSRTFDSKKYPLATDTLEKIFSLHSATGGWGGCVRSILSFGAKIPESEDTYNPSFIEAGNSDAGNWVNGPNRQFERTFRHIQDSGAYDAMLIMEPDTFPVAPGWLDSLLKEVESSKPFAILGSKYDGNAWDDFAEHMPLALLHHINGNAVYNITHPLMNKIVTELEAEAKSMYNAIPYDYRISQMLIEGSLGIPPNFPYDKIREEDGKAVILRPKRDKLAAWWDNYAKEHEPIQESVVITNLAAAPFLPRDIGSASIVHGKHMFEPWDEETHGRITLVVSEWSETKGRAKDFFLRLGSSNHPFSEVIVMKTSVYDESIADGTEESKTSKVQSIFQSREAPPYMDLCDANVTSDWFVMTDFYHAPLPHIDIMFAADGTGRPVVSFLPAEGKYCSESKACVETLAQSRQFFPGMGQFMLSSDMLFHRTHRDQFCREWKKKFGSEGEIIRNAKDLDNKDLPTTKDTSSLKGPVATSYVAYLRSLNIAEAAYIFNDAARFGIRRNFVTVKEEVSRATMKSNIANIAPLPHSQDDSNIPLFWHIPRSGGTTMHVVFGNCLGLTLASSSGSILEEQQDTLVNGAKHRRDALRVVTRGKLKFANVDVSTPNGIARAGDLDLIGSGLVDVVKTHLVYDAVGGIFSPDVGRQAKLFTLFRHPAERATSMFYYLQHAYWEPTYDPALENMTIEEYAMSDKVERNWMVWMLNNEPQMEDQQHLEIAKDILREQIVVGLFSEMGASVDRFKEYFGWGDNHEGWNNCENHVLFKEGANVNHHQAVAKGSEVWELLSSKNAMDVALYDFAVEMFEVQGREIFNAGKFDPHHPDTLSSLSDDAGGVDDTGVAVMSKNRNAEPCLVMPTLTDLSEENVRMYNDFMESFVLSISRGTSIFDMTTLKKKGIVWGQPEDSDIPRYVELSAGFGPNALGANFAFADVASSKVVGHAWNSTDTVVSPTESGFELPTQEMMDPSGKSSVWEKHTNIVGDHVAYMSWFSGNYAHYLSDHLPLLAWMRETVSPDCKFLLAYHPRNEEILRAVDEAFVDERVVWVMPGREVVTVRDGTLGVLVTKPPVRNQKIVQSLRRWLLKTQGSIMPQSPPAGGASVAMLRNRNTATTRKIAASEEEGENKPHAIVYYTRSGSTDTHHGCVIDPQHESHILKLIKSKMKEHGLDQTHRVVLYNGQEKGKTMTVARQAELFRTATAVIGPHGAGMANIIWMTGLEDKEGVEDSKGGEKQTAFARDDLGGGQPHIRPQVLEYLIGPKSTQVHAFRTAFAKSFYQMYSTARWIEYHHVLYAANSTNSRTFVDLRAMRMALDQMWGERQTERQEKDKIEAEANDEDENDETALHSTSSINPSAFLPHYYQAKGVSARDHDTVEEELERVVGLYSERRMDQYPSSTTSSTATITATPTATATTPDMSTSTTTTTTTCLLCETTPSADMTPTIAATTTMTTPGTATTASTTTETTTDTTADTTTTTTTTTTATVVPTASPTVAPTARPSTSPTGSPATDAPATDRPTWQPVKGPVTGHPSPEPTTAPTAVGPTFGPTAIPTASPTAGPTLAPTVAPTARPSTSPTGSPATDAPATDRPTWQPMEGPVTGHPSPEPTTAPTSVGPTVGPTAIPTASPTVTPTARPSTSPTGSPATDAPATDRPTWQPMEGPVMGHPSPGPTTAPTTVGPTVGPTVIPTASPTAGPTLAPTVAPTPRPSTSPTGSPGTGAIAFTWTDPSDPSAITWNNPVTQYVEAFQSVKDAWDQISESLNQGVQNLKAAVDALSDILPDDFSNWSSFDFLGAIDSVKTAYENVVAAVNAVKDIPNTVKAAADDLIEKIQNAKLENFLSINVQPLTGKALVLDIKKVNDAGPDEIGISNMPQDLSSTSSFPPNPAKLGSYSPSLGTKSLDHEQTLTLNGNLGLQKYMVTYDDEVYFPSRQVDGWTEEKTFLELQLKWADMQGPLGTIDVINTAVSQAIATVNVIIDVIPNPGDTIDLVKAPLSFIRITLGNAVKIIRTAAETAFKATVVAAGDMIEALPEKDPPNAAENTDSVANAVIFPQYVP